MHFCDRDYVRSFFEGKRVALVGSGPGSMSNDIGFVDSFDVVVRVNNYKLLQGTGERTDVHYSFYGTSIKKTAEDLQRDGVKLCICKCPNDQFIESPWHRARNKMAGVDFRYIYKAREAWWFCPTYVPTTEQFLEDFNLLGKHVPTTGFSALLELLRHDPAHIYMTGFDFFSSGVHNVNERWRPGNPTDPIGHSPQAERKWFAQNRGKHAITMDHALTRCLRGVQ